MGYLTHCDLVFFARNLLCARSPTCFRFRFFEAQIRKEESTIIFWYKSIYILFCLVFEYNTIFDIDISASANLAHQASIHCTCFKTKSPSAWVVLFLFQKCSDVQRTCLQIALFADVFNLNVTHFCLLAKNKQGKQCRLQNLTSILLHQNPHQNRYQY